jgi:extradiol dioxygenase family protein
MRIPGRLDDLAPQLCSHPVWATLRVRDLVEAQDFFRQVFGCRPSDKGDTSVNFLPFGLHVTCRLRWEIGRQEDASPKEKRESVDTPTPDFSVELIELEWDALVRRLREHHVKFVIVPNLACFPNGSSARAALYCFDPSGNELEFKQIRPSETLWSHHRLLRARFSAFFLVALLACLVCAILVLRSQQRDDNNKLEIIAPQSSAYCRSLIIC